MEAKRNEMLENAKWRNAVRSDNVKRAAELEDHEEKDNEGKVGNFIRLGFQFNTLLD